MTTKLYMLYTIYRFAYFPFIQFYVYDQVKRTLIRIPNMRLIRVSSYFYKKMPILYVFCN